MSVGTLSDFQRTGPTGSVVVSDTPNDCELYIIGSNLAGDRANAIVYYGESNPGIRDLDFSAFTDGDHINITGYIYDSGMGTVDYLTNNLGPLPAFAGKPTTPILSNLIREGPSGSIQVSGVKETETTRVYGFMLIKDIMLPYMVVERLELGVRLGEGEIVLDFSEVYTAPTSWPCSPIFAIAEDVAGNKSDMSELVETSVGGDFPFTLVSVVRTGPTTGKLTIADADPTTLLAAVWYMANGDVKFAYRIGSGDITLTPLELNLRHGFTVFAVSNLGQWKFNGITEQVLEWLIPNPSIVPRRKPEIVRR